MVQEYFNKFNSYILVSDFNLLKSMGFDFQTMNGYQTADFEERFINYMQKLLEAREYDSILSEIEAFVGSWVELNPSDCDKIHMKGLVITADYWEHL